MGFLPYNYHSYQTHIPKVTKPEHEDFVVSADLSTMPPGDWKVTVTASEPETGLNHTANVTAVLQVRNLIVQ